MFENLPGIKNAIIIDIHQDALDIMETVYSVYPNALLDIIFHTTLDGKIKAIVRKNNAGMSIFSIAIGGGIKINVQLLFSEQNKSTSYASWCDFRVVTMDQQYLSGYRVIHGWEFQPITPNSLDDLKKSLLIHKMSEIIEMKLFGNSHDDAKKAILEMLGMPGKIVWQILESIFELRQHFPYMSTDIHFCLGLNGKIEYANSSYSEISDARLVISLNNGYDRVVFYKNYKDDISYCVYRDKEKYDDNKEKKPFAKDGQVKVGKRVLDKLQQELLALKLTQIIET